MSFLTLRVGTLTWVFAGNRAWLFNKINLETDNEFYYVGIPTYWNYCEEVHEGLATFAVVDQTNLRFFVGTDHIFKIEHGVVINISSLQACLNFAIGSLKEAAVTTQDFMLVVPG